MAKHSHRDLEEETRERDRKRQLDEKKLLDLQLHYFTVLSLLIIYDKNENIRLVKEKMCTLLCQLFNFQKLGSTPRGQKAVI